MHKVPSAKGTNSFTSYEKNAIGSIVIFPNEFNW